MAANLMKRGDGCLNTVSRPPPGMKVTEKSTTEDLIKWQKMYTNNFFNPKERVITEDDVVESLKFYNSTADKSSKLSHKGCKDLMHKGRKYYSYQNNFGFNSWQVNNYLKECVPSHSKPCTATKEKKGIVDTKSDYYSNMCRAKPHLLEKKSLGTPTRSLLRRPEVPVIYDIFRRDLITPCSPSMGKVSTPDSGRDRITPSSTPHSLHSKMESHESFYNYKDYMDDYIDYFDSFREKSLTTFFDAKPFTVDSFYVQNYPLLMHTVPRRHQRMAEIEIPADKQMSLTFFQNLSGHPVQAASDESMNSENQELGTLPDISKRPRFRRMSVLKP